MSKFSNIIIGSIFAAGLATGAAEQDIRGLAFYTEPEAFFVEEDAEPVPMNFPVVWGEASGPLDVPVIQEAQRQSSRINTPSQQLASLSDSLINNGDTSPPPSAAQIGSSSPSPSAVQQQAELARPTPAAPPSIPPETSDAPSPAFTPAPQPVQVGTLDGLPSDFENGGGIVNVEPGEEPVVEDPTPPTDVEPTVPDPVVPAVPEPSSWLLMILGVGLIGTMLRYRREDDYIECELKPI